MSWFASIPNTRVADVENAAKRTTFNSTGDNGGVEGVEQLDAALAAVVALVQSGAIGTQMFTASLSGHANANHLPRAGWADDTIHVSVTAVYVKPDEKPEDATSITEVTTHN